MFALLYSDWSIFWFLACYSGSLHFSYRFCQSSRLMLFCGTGCRLGCRFLFCRSCDHSWALRFESRPTSFHSGCRLGHLFYLRLTSSSRLSESLEINCFCSLFYSQIMVIDSCLPFPHFFLRFADLTDFNWYLEINLFEHLNELHSPLKVMI